MDIGMPPSTLRSELIEGLTLFFSIIEMVLLVTPARLASSRWERPLSFRMDCSRSPTSKAEASCCCRDIERHHGDSVQYLQHLAQASASSPGIEPWYPAQV